MRYEDFIENELYIVKSPTGTSIEYIILKNSILYMKTIKNITSDYPVDFTTPIGQDLSYNAYLITPLEKVKYL